MNLDLNCFEDTFYFYRIWSFYITLSGQLQVRQDPEIKKMAKIKF